VAAAKRRALSGPAPTDQEFRMIRPLHAVPSLVALAAAALFAGPALAAITSSGNLGPDPASGTVAGRLQVGSGAAGQVQVDGGSLLTVQQLGLGDGGTGTGTLLVSGAGSRVVVDGLNVSGLGNLDLGGWGTGSLSVLAGASFAHGVATTACFSGCVTFIGNAAGANGSLLVSGPGSVYSTVGRTVIANGSAFTSAADGFDYGTPGATTRGEVRVQDSATLRSAQIVVGTSGGGLGRTGGEQSFANLVVDGAGTLLAMTRASTTTGNASLLSIATGFNATGTVEVRNGARLTIDGSTAPTVFTGINVGSGGATSNGTLRIDGAGSLIELSGGQGFINVGTNVAGSVGHMQVTGGARVAGVGETGLAFTSVGRDGATGTLTVSGSDAAGNASTLRLAGRNSVTDGGAFLNIGGIYNSGRSGNGTVDVLAGGRIEVDTSALTGGVGNARPGAYVGVGQGAVGNLTIVGGNAVTGAASTLAITGGSGVTPFVGVGKDGATGNVLVSNGGRWLISSTHLSTTNANGDLLQLNIGDRGTGPENPGSNPSVGTVTVTGAGSELALTGASDRYLSVGGGSGGSGTLNVAGGGVVRSLSLLVGSGDGATGTVNVDGGRIELGGRVNAGPAAGTGGSFSVGRSGGTGTATFSNGAVLQISTSTANASINAGGTGPAPGGTGTINVFGGSLLAVSGPSATLRVGGASSATAAGIGTLNLAGAGSSVQLVGNGARALIGAAAGTEGTVNIGQGTTLSAGSFLGIAHDGTNDTGGAGLLVVNGVASATTIVNGVFGKIQGSGILVGNVVNHGQINPGNSPGTLVIDGSFTNAPGGQLVLEVASDGHGGFVTDHLVFSNTSTVDLAGLQVEFRFLGSADPTAFQAGGGFATGSFFAQQDAQGQAAALADTAFGGVQFSASSQAYSISNFSFSAAAGAQFTAAPVPEPATWALWLTGALALALAGRANRRRRPAA
jgi:T5SS/PEP-CTERM-associated repeat protein